jgi:hypothetical protein
MFSENAKTRAKALKQLAFLTLSTSCAFFPKCSMSLAKDFLRVHLLCKNKKGRGDIGHRDPLPLNKKAAGRLSGLPAA